MRRETVRQGARIDGVIINNSGANVFVLPYISNRKLGYDTYERCRAEKIHVPEDFMP